MARRIGYKVYVDVTARFCDDGRLLPLSFVWEDGTRFSIDRILGHQRMASRKAGGCGEMYLCVVGGRRVHLYYEGNYLWFLEAR
ncbi:MAG: hypothetical protein IKS07_11340 [Lachnospiraceae bacterium]|nr:hypothetical protein [Lachnospiraceae bacterium]MCR5478114.1 hypothetical protein [Lachnospiraceae bacterium]